MQGYHSSLIVFGLCITAISAQLSIQFLQPGVNTSIPNNRTTYGANDIQLWVNVTDCPVSSCGCEIKANGIADKVSFTFIHPNTLGFSKITNLHPYTNYSFSLNCSNSETSATLQQGLRVTTDSGRPSPPQNISVTLVDKNLEINWLPPSAPAGPVDIYRIKIDGEKEETNITDKKNSYIVSKEYAPGTSHTIYVSACNENKQDGLLCSVFDNGKQTYDPVTVATSTPTTTTIPSTGVQSYSISVSMIIFFLCFFNQI